MSRSILLFAWILSSGLAAVAGSDQPAQDSGLRLLLNEVRPGGMSTEQRCTLVFADHRFHHEVANSKLGRDLDRKVYEGELSQADWDTLLGILERKEFRDLAVPMPVPPPVMQDMHIYDISVAREGKFQNMEFLNDKSRKSYDAEVKPLLQWWKSFYSRHLADSHAPTNSHCSPSDRGAVFSR